MQEPLSFKQIKMSNIQVVKELVLLKTRCQCLMVHQI